MSGQRPWAASNNTDDEEGVVRLFNEKDDLVAELTPEHARALAGELADVASYVDGVTFVYGKGCSDPDRSEGHCCG